MAEQKQAVKKRFFRDTMAELKRVIWPSAKTVAKSTLVVIVVIVIITLLIFLFDTGLSAGMRWVLSFAS